MDKNANFSIKKADNVLAQMLSKIYQNKTINNNPNQGDPNEKLNRHHRPRRTERLRI